MSNLWRGVIVTAVVVWGAIVALWALSQIVSGTSRPETLLPLIVLIGTLVTLLTILAIVSVAALFGLTNPGHAFGLPPGTIQAVIAVTLIILFPVMTLFLYSNIADPAPHVETGLTPEEADALPRDLLISETEMEDGTFTVVLRGRTTESSDQIARELVTILGTLVTAVVAFYFGARAVESGSAATLSAAAAASGAGQVWLRIVNPTGDQKLVASPGTKLSDIRVVSAPGSSLDWSVEGDQADTLRMVRPETFEYVRGPSAADTVVLRFEIAGRPDTRQTVSISKKS